MFVRGIVAQGSGGAMGTRDGAWVMSIDLRPYRDEAGVLRDGELRLWTRLPDGAALQREKKRIPKPGAVVSADVLRFGDIPGLDRPCGLYERVLEDWSEDEDDELVAFAAATAPPPEVVVEGVGTFRFNAGLRCYEASVRTAMGLGALSMEPKDARSPQATLAGAGALVAEVERMWPALLAAVAAELFDTWRENWADSDEDADEADMSREQWCARLVFDGISKYVDAPGFTVWLKDGDLFAGHGIHVAVDEGKVTDVGMAG